MSGSSALAVQGPTHRHCCLSESEGRGSPLPAADAGAPKAGGAAAAPVAVNGAVLNE